MQAGGWGQDGREMCDVLFWADYADGLLFAVIMLMF